MSQNTKRLENISEIDLSGFLIRSVIGGRSKTPGFYFLQTFGVNQF